MGFYRTFIKLRQFFGLNYNNNNDDLFVVLIN